MSSEVSETGTGSSEQPAPAKVQAEQKQPSTQDRLIAQAIAEGQMDAIIPVEPEMEVEPEASEEDMDLSSSESTEVPEASTEDEDTTEPEEEEEEKAAAKKEPDHKKLVPLSEVLEEREKKKRANDRYDNLDIEYQKAQGRIRELETQLSQSSGPVPTQDNPMSDIQNQRDLDTLERVYEEVKEVSLENLNEDGTITMPTGIGNDGKFVYRKLPPDEARIAQIRADRCVRRFIPQRRAYLTERAKIDAEASQVFPQLNEPDSEFARLANQWTTEVVSGRATNNPQVKFLASLAVYGLAKLQEEQAKAGQNGNGKHPEADVQKIVAASKQKIAPSSPRERTLPKRQTASADLAKANQRLKENPGSEEAELEFLRASRLAAKGQTKVVPQS